MKPAAPEKPLQPADAAAQHPGDFARAVLGTLARDLARQLRRIAKGGEPRAVGKAIHDARILTRRLEVAAASLGPMLDEVRAADLADAARKARRDLGEARDAEVLGALLRVRIKRLPAPARPAALDAAERIERSLKKRRREARRAAARRCDRLDRKSLRKSLDRAVWTGPMGGRELAAHALDALLAQARAAAAADLRAIARVHALRIALKRFRYGLELFSPWLEARPLARAVASLRRLQRTLGLVNDEDGLVRVVAALAARPRDGKNAPAARSRRALAAALRAGLREAAAEFRAAWRRAGQSRLLDKAGLLWAAPKPSRPAEAPRFSFHAPAAGASRPPRRRAAPTSPVRLAAIDIGTNSTRLIIAEASPDGTYRILDDEKELTRLGAGLEATGRIDDRALEQTAFTVAKMKRIAEGYGASAIRGVATCAVRDASNGARLIDLIRQWAGLRVDVISGEEEAWLAFRSVAHAFDLSTFTSAVIDVGGGSTEVILSSGSAVEAVVSLPIGAVRLTEKFGGADAAAGERYKAMRRYVRGLLAERLARVPFEPQLVIGTGGTCTSLAAMAMQRERERSPHAPPPSAVQGFEIKRALVADLLETLRSVDLADRARVPGLSADRADIIVAGVLIVHEIMEWLGATRLRAHDGGIRDGLLLSMVQEVFPGAADPGRRAAARADDPVAAAERFATACRMDLRHGRQAARLALRIFDQLAPPKRAAAAPAWASPRSRIVLHCACLLLDVGYVINYTKHHVHSCNLIRHSELAGLSQREVELVAQVARYHRGADPRPGHDQFAALDDAEQETVRRLAAIVRIAVGLDRTHTQAVNDVRLAVRGGAARFLISAAENPGVDIWGAERKAGLFAEVFGLEARFAWGGGKKRAAAPSLNGVHRATRTQRV